MKKLLVPTLLTLFFTSVHGANPTVKVAPLETKKIEIELDKKSDPNMRLVYEELEQVALQLKKNFRQDELERILGFYKKINQIDKKHFYVEMFVGIYKTHKSEFEVALKKALSSEDQKEFMRKLDIAITESEEGNG